MAITAQQAAENWLAGLRNSTARIRQGVEAVRESPTAAAARQLPKFLERVTAAVQDGSMAAALNAVSREEWVSAFINKGLPRIASGAAAAQNRFVQFMTEFLPHVLAGAEQVRQMPSGTVEDGINRAAAMIRHNASFRRTRR